MKKQNIWLWALTAAVVLLAAALAETQGQLGELQTAYSALQQEVGELRLPFWLFPEKKQPPAVVAYLGKVLPPAMMGLLVVYCLRSISWLSAPHGAPELIAIAAVAGLHLWKRNVLLSIAGGTVLSIAGGTVLYMVLVQAVFV